MLGIEEITPVSKPSEMWIRFKAVITGIIVVTIWMVISFGLIYTSLHANLRSDTLLNVTRMSAPETGAKHAEDGYLANCTPPSLQNCEAFDQGKWYVEANNSFYGKQLRYSYYVADGEIVYCERYKAKPRNATGWNYEHVPCSYFVGVFMSLGCLVSAFFIVLYAGSDPESVIFWNFLGICMSWSTFFIALLWAGTITVKEVKTLRGEDIDYESFSDHTFPAMLHYYLLSTVGWLGILSQKFFMVKNERRGSHSLIQYVHRRIMHWIPYLSCFALYFAGSALLSITAPFYPFDHRADCDESCWVNQKSLIADFAGPIVMITLVNFHGYVMMKYREPQLIEGHLKKNFVVLIKLLIAMDGIWLFGLFVNSCEGFVFLRTIFRMITLAEGYLVCLFTVYCTKLDKVF